MRNGKNAAEGVFLLGLRECVATQQALSSLYHNTEGGRAILKELLSLLVQNRRPEAYPMLSCWKWPNLPARRRSPPRYRPWWFLTIEKPCYGARLKRWSGPKPATRSRSWWWTTVPPTAARSSKPSFPRARFIRIPRNFGLTKALNLGVRGSEAEYVFFLHEDTEVFPETARLLAGLLDAQPDAGAVCPLLVDAEGKPAPQLGKFPPDDTWRPAEPGADPMPVDYPRGAALMMRRFFFTAIRQIDERYGQFGSDADLCFQIRRAGKRSCWSPQARARHEGARRGIAPCA